MTINAAVKSWKLNSTSTRALFVGAQLLAFVSFILALEFLRQTTGGTLFVFSTIAPVLACLAASAVPGVATYRFLRRPSLFVIETVDTARVIFQQWEEGAFAYFIQRGSG